MALGLRAEDFMAGWLYLGTPGGKFLPASRPDPEDFLSVLGD